jgi:large subunit ribosomal protein L19e
MSAESQRRLASEILGVGKNKILFDKNKIEDIKKAITRLDIKELIKEGAIKVRIKKKIKVKREKRNKGVGHTRVKVKRRKEKYVRKIRKLRKYIQEMADKKILANDEKKHLRKMAKAGELKSLRHLQEYITSIMKKNLPTKK